MDKMNLLFYSYSVSFIFMFPLWLVYDAHAVSQNLPSIHILGLLALNGISHFLQNVVAFSILAMVSPVTYSIASLIKRIFVILGGILILGDRISPIQSFGISLTFVGLYFYDQARHSHQEHHSELPRFQATSDHRPADAA